jgi:four helix bundle protein
MDFKQTLEQRLINFSILVIEVINYLPDNRVGNHLGGQLLRSGTSPALHYGEAIDTESRKDFPRKLGAILKELQQSYSCLKILSKINYITRNDLALLECNELISIFVKSIKPTKKNSNTPLIRKSHLANHNSQFKTQSSFSNI